jgi:hypothetical protein
VAFSCDYLARLVIVTDLGDLIIISFKRYSKEWLFCDYLARPICHLDAGEILIIIDFKSVIRKSDLFMEKRKYKCELYV